MLPAYWRQELRLANANVPRLQVAVASAVLLVVDGLSDNHRNYIILAVGTRETAAAVRQLLTA
jgi:hypothetical protein